MEQPHRVTDQQVEQRATELFVEPTPKTNKEYNLTKIYFAEIDWDWMGQLIKEINNDDKE